MDDKIGEKMMPLPWCGELEKKNGDRLRGGMETEDPLSLVQRRRREVRRAAIPLYGLCEPAL